MRVDLCRLGISKHFSVHKLVAWAFIENPDNLKMINHLNAIKSNNKWNNLEWCTGQQNMIHARANGLLHPAKGEKAGAAKLTDKQVIELRARYIPKKYGVRRLARDYRLSVFTVRSIVSGKTWQYLLTRSEIRKRMQKTLKNPVSRK